jgi:transcriptional regulator GlxA family with amidase domain
VEVAETKRRTVGILIFDDVEVLDFAGPFEVFSVAQPSEGASAGPDDQHLFTVWTIAESRDLVRCRNGLLVQPHHTIDDHPPLDILVVPGGYGTRRLQTHQPVLDWIVAQDGQTELTTSVCTGSVLLAFAGLLEGKPATTHWGSVDRLREHFPRTEVIADQRYVDAGRVVTSAGVSAGIDMALYVVDRLHGAATAATTARYMQYDHWRG